LQQSVFSAITAVSFRIREVLRAIELYDDAERFVEEIDLI
jgi:hypothetical protein